MAYVYIANGTQQFQEFIYTLPEKNGQFRVTIAPGSQQRLPHDCSPMDIESIENQHRKYGLIRSDEVSRVKGFHGLCFSIGKPVNLNSIHGLLLVNNDTLVERGKRIREEAGVAIHSQIEELFARQQLPARLNAASTSIQEDSREPTFAEGIRVSVDNATNQPPPARQPRRRVSRPR